MAKPKIIASIEPLNFPEFNSRGEIRFAAIDISVGAILSEDGDALKIEGIKVNHEYDRGNASHLKNGEYPVFNLSFGRFGSKQLFISTLLTTLNGVSNTERFDNAHSAIERVADVIEKLMKVHCSHANDLATGEVSDDVEPFPKSAFTFSDYLKGYDISYKDGEEEVRVESRVYGFDGANIGGESLVLRYVSLPTKMLLMKPVSQ